jgi:hypothetical protein
MFFLFGSESGVGVDVDVDVGHAELSTRRALHT